MKAEEIRPKKSDERREFAARLLFESAFATDAEVARKYGITERTINNYRRRLGEDMLLAGLVAAKRREFEKAWSGTLPVTPAGAADALNEIARQMRAGGSVTPEAVEGIAATLRAVARLLPAAGPRASQGDRRTGPALNKW